MCVYGAIDEAEVLCLSAVSIDAVLCVYVYASVCVNARS